MPPRVITGRIAGKKEKPRIIRFVDCSGEWINNRTNEDDIGEEIEKLVRKFSNCAYSSLIRSAIAVILF